MKECLNCGNATNERFCSACGQKTDTHRITITRFVAHDLLHGVWHLEKGILFTLKEAFIRPGQAALDYISGKRIRYYNVFYLCLLLLGANILAVHFLGKYIDSGEVSEQSNRVTAFLSQYVRFVVFAVVPLLAVNSIMIFRRLQLNFAEHLILAGFCLVGGLVLSILFYIFNFLTNISSWYLTAYVEVALFFSMLLLPLWTYWNASKRFYPTLGRLWRTLLFYILLLVEFLLLSSLIIYLLTGGTELEVSL